jgi:hypothetical protein
MKKKKNVNLSIDIKLLERIKKVQANAGDFPPTQTAIFEKGVARVLDELEKLYPDKSSRD